MAEPISLAGRRSPLDGYGQRFATAGTDQTVRLREVAFLAMTDLRARDDDQRSLALAEHTLGLALPRAPGSSADADRSVLWLGPQWWLVLGRPGTEAATATHLRDALAGRPVSVVDVSAQRTTLELTGPRATDVLMTGCAIDLHERAFPPGSCAQTLLGRANVALHHRPADAGGRPTYWALVGASFAGYLADWLLDALVEVG